MVLLKIVMGLVILEISSGWFLKNDVINVVINYKVLNFCVSKIIRLGDGEIFIDVSNIFWMLYCLVVFY